jgi:hypothetical protein
MVFQKKINISFESIFYKALQYRRYYTGKTNYNSFFFNNSMAWLAARAVKAIYVNEGF